MVAKNNIHRILISLFTLFKNLSERVFRQLTHVLLKEAMSKTTERMASPTTSSSHLDLHLYIATEVQHLVVQIFVYDVLLHVFEYNVVFCFLVRKT